RIRGFPARSACSFSSWLHTCHVGRCTGLLSSLMLGGSSCDWFSRPQRVSLLLALCLVCRSCALSPRGSTRGRSG
ncbi:hypothetical protein PFISCL1PPCAC_18745, partial [Pristionchus fissidentatus]